MKGKHLRDGSVHWYAPRVNARGTKTSDADTAPKSWRSRTLKNDCGHSDKLYIREAKQVPNRYFRYIDTSLCRKSKLHQEYSIKHRTAQRCALSIELQEERVYDSYLHQWPGNFLKEVSYGKITYHGCDSGTHWDSLSESKYCYKNRHQSLSQSVAKEQNITCLGTWSTCVGWLHFSFKNRLNWVRMLEKICEHQVKL